MRNSQLLKLLFASFLNKSTNDTIWIRIIFCTKFFPHVDIFLNFYKIIWDVHKANNRCPCVTIFAYERQLPVVTEQNIPNFNETEVYSLKSINLFYDCVKQPYSSGTLLQKLTIRLNNYWKLVLFISLMIIYDWSIPAHPYTHPQA